MKVLVFDDNEIHLKAAMAQLVGHDVTLVDSYLAAQRELQKNQFDVFLTDLLVPAKASGMSMEGYKLLGQEMPLGIFVALLGALKGVKYVGLLTDSNHHNHPASYCLDAFNGGTNGAPIPFRVGEAKVIFTNAPWLVDWFWVDDLSRPANLDEMEKIHAREGRSGEEMDQLFLASGKLAKAKCWNDLLDYLLK